MLWCLKLFVYQILNYLHSFVNDISSLCLYKKDMANPKSSSPSATKLESVKSHQAMYGNDSIELLIERSGPNVTIKILAISGIENWIKHFTTQNSLSLKLSEKSEGVQIIRKKWRINSSCFCFEPRELCKNILMWQSTWYTAVNYK